MISIEPLVRHRRPVIALFLLLALASFPGLLELELDNRPEGYFLRSAEALAEYRQFEIDFGRDRAVRMVLHGEEVWSAAGLAWVGDLEERVQSLPEVLGAVGIYRHHRWRFPTWPPPDPAAFRRRVTEDLVDRNAGWVGADGDLLTILVSLARLSPERQRRTLERLEGLLEGAPAEETALVGLAPIERSVDRSMVAILVRLMPLLTLLCLLFLTLLFGLGREILAPLILVSACLSVVFGSMGYFGVGIDLVSVLLLPLLTIVGLATATHVLAGFRQLRQRGLGAEEATTEIYRIKLWPVVWTGITTASGFGSLSLSGMPPIATFGLWSAFGFSFLTLAAVSLYPALLATLAAAGDERARTTRRCEVRCKRLGRRLAGWADRRRRLVTTGFALFALLVGSGLLRLRTDSHPIGYLSPRHPQRLEIARLEAAGVGTFAAELVLTAPAAGDGFDNTAALAALSRLSATLRERLRPLGALSAGDLLASLASAAPQGSTEAAIREGRARARSTEELRRMLAFLLTIDGRRTRLPLLLSSTSLQELDRQFELAVELAEESFPGAEAIVTGQYPLLVRARAELARTLVWSFGVTLLCVTLVFRVMLGGLRLTLRALLPNLWAVVCILGVMGWAGLPLEAITVMIAAATLGLAVDDSLHFLGYFRRHAGPGRSRQATVRALGETAGAHLLTSLLLVTGLSVTTLSDLVPIARFGSLTGLAILLALVADLLLMPALFAHTSDADLGRLGKSGLRLRRGRAADLPPA